MAAKITKLLPEQERELEAHLATWRAIGTRTGHDAECETTGRAAIDDAYKALGFEPPKLALWAQSPMQALLMHWAMRGLLDRGSGEGSTPTDVDLSLRGSLGDELGGRLGGRLGGQLEGQLGGQLRDQLGGQLGGQLGDRLWGQLEDQLRGQLWDQLWDQLGNQLQGQFLDQLQGAYNQIWCWGQCESYWTAFYRFAISIGVKVTDEQERRLQIWERLACSTFMVLSWRGISILVQHPTIARFDDRGRLHAVDGPALAWHDGYAVYAISGIRLTPERGAEIAAGTVTATQIRDEPNAEVRRVLVGAYNAGDTGRYLRDIGATVIDADLDALGLPRRLLRIEQPDDEPIIAIEVTNSTPEPDGSRKLYTFRCDPECRPLPIGPRSGWPKENRGPQELTCQNAIASTFGHTGPEYQLAVQT